MADFLRKLHFVLCNNTLAAFEAFEKESLGKLEWFFYQGSICKIAIIVWVEAAFKAHDRLHYPHPALAWLWLWPSLNTQSCIKGFFVVRDFCFWTVWAAGPVLKKKKFWADYEQLLRAFFFLFSGAIFFEIWLIDQLYIKLGQEPS